MTFMETLRGWLGAPERRDYQPPVTMTTLGVGVPCEPANPYLAENLAVVLAAVNILSGTMAALPVIVYTRRQGERIEQPDHWLQKLVRGGPNSQQVWGGLIESAVASVELHGNALVEIERDENGSVNGLRFIPWPWVTAQLLSTGRMAFDVYEPQMPAMGARKRRLLAADVIHLKDRSDDGLIGRSRLSRARETLRAATAQQTFATAFLERGAQPSGVLEVPGTMSQEQRTTLREAFKSRHGGADNAGSTLVLDGGISWKSAQISPEDAELLASRRFSVEEIARVFGVPPPLVGDLTHGTFTNSREAARWFGQFSLTPRVRRIEAELNRALFGPGSRYEIEFDMSDLLRSDPETRWASHKIAVEAGILDPEEIRQIEGWNPRKVEAAG
ncbi:hypothetical protein M527_01800 [Sphingobium indicum IP26]|uniref:phage portal protein n=1 Tax=Sphingobium indicum TaxID=332055 RepID=UPI000378F3C5|nr:hypothetical protein M527_01800 [Sphingobium indicum IP26]